MCVREREGGGERERERERRERGREGGREGGREREGVNFCIFPPPPITPSPDPSYCKTGQRDMGPSGRH